MTYHSPLRIAAVRFGGGDHRPLKWVRWSLFFSLVFAGALLLFMYDPAVNSLYPSCVFRRLTGFLCPGCGTLRAIHQMLHGNLVGAVRLNPLAVTAAPFVSYEIVARCIRDLTGETRLPLIPLNAGRISALLVVILIHAVLRNVTL